MERLTRSDPILAARDPSSAIHANTSVSMMAMAERQVVGRRRRAEQAVFMR